MKFGHFKKYNMKVMIKNHTQNEAWRLVPDQFLFFQVLYNFLSGKKSKWPAA